MTGTEESREVFMASPLTYLSFLIPTLFLASMPSWSQQTPAQAEPAVQCKPMSQRTGELGCWTLADQPIGPLTKSQVFWHLDTYPTPAAANAAKGPRGVVANSFGKNWLLTIEIDAWQAPAGGEHVATIGPLPIPAADSYTATYVEAIFTPGMKSAIHDHPGPEAFFTVTGETCLETSEGMSVERPGGPPVIVAAGLPMQLTAIGKDNRQGFALVLHDQSQPGGHPVHNWTPKDLCKY
jgi:quercetin dioxygenase-like cupin family protein